MTTQHTPGPWKVYAGTIIRMCADGEASVARADVFRPHSWKGHTIDEAEAEANSRLIAAAPQLLEALQSIEEAYRTIADQPPYELRPLLLRLTELRHSWQAAIAAATGRNASRQP